MLYIKRKRICYNRNRKFREVIMFSDINFQESVSGIQTTVFHTRTDEAQTTGDTTQQTMYLNEQIIKRKTELSLEQMLEQNLLIGGNTTYAYMKSIQQLEEERSNSYPKDLEEQMKKVGREKIDSRIFNFYCTGYKKNQSGEPLNEEEKQKKLQDESFVADFISLDTKRREPHLRRIVDEILNADIRMDMFEDEYLQKHITPMLVLSGRMMYLENLKKDKENEVFFAKLPTFEKDMLEARWATISTAFGILLNNILGSKGINMNKDKGELITEQSVCRELLGMIEGNKAFLSSSIEVSKSKEKAAYQNELKRELRAFRNRTLENRTRYEELMNLKEKIDTLLQQNKENGNDLKDIFQDSFQLYEDLIYCETDIAGCEHVLELYKESGGLYQGVFQLATEKLKELNKQRENIETLWNRRIMQVDNLSGDEGDKKIELTSREELKKDYTIGRFKDYCLRRTLLENKTGKNNSFFAGYNKIALEKGVDIRVLNTYIQGYRKDVNGRPLNQKEEEKQKSDEKFLKDYLSQDIKLRQQHLEVMRKEILSFEFSFDMVKDGNLIKNADYLINMSDKLMYFENVMKDPHNHEYFESLSVVEKKSLEIQLKKYTSFGMYITHLIKIHGIETSSHGVAYMSNSEEDYTDVIETVGMMIPGDEYLLKEALAQGEREKRELNENVEKSKQYAEKQTTLIQSLSEKETDVSHKRNQRLKHLSFLHKWSTKNREEIKERFTKEEKPLQVIHASTVAQGTPVQTVKPPKKSFRQWLEKKRRSIVAKWHIWAGDHVSYTINEKLKPYQKNIENRIPENEMERLNVNPLLKNVLRVFSEEYQTNAVGIPINNEEQQKRDRNIEFMNDYISNDYQRRRKHLERMTNEILNLNLTEDMLTNEYIEKNIVKLKLISDKLKCFEAVKNDTSNCFYFDNMSEYEKEVLRKRWNGRYQEFNELLNARLAIKGIDLETGTYITDKEKKNNIKQYKKEIGIYQEDYKNALQRAKVEEEGYIKDILKKEKEEVTAYFLKRFKSHQGSELFSVYATADMVSELQEVREKFVNHDINYRMNQDILDRLYQKLHCILDVEGEIQLGASVAIQMKSNHRLDTPFDKHLCSYIENTFEQGIQKRRKIRASVTGLKALIDYILDETCGMTEVVKETANEEGIQSDVEVIEITRWKQLQKESF